MPDYLGQPAYMVGLDPTASFTSASSISSGTLVPVTVTGAPVNRSLVGEVLILDRANPASLEAVTIFDANPTTGVLILQSVTTSHTGPVTMELGLTISEERALPANRSQTRVSRFPVYRIQSAFGRYGYGRRGNQISGQMQEFNLLATISSFGGPPVWQPIDTTQIDINSATGELWVPAGLLLAYYSEVRLRYIAGWSQSAVPPVIKQAVANIISAFGDTPTTANIRSISAAGISMSRQSASFLDDDTKHMLEPYKARVWA